MDAIGTPNQIGCLLCHASQLDVIVSTHTTSTTTTMSLDAPVQVESGNLKRKRETRWVVLLMDHHDDYKNRYGAWTETRKPRLFTSEAKANEHLRRLLKSIANEYLSELFVEHLSPERKAKLDGNVYIKWNAEDECYRVYKSAPLQVVEAILAPFIEGEFVPVKLSWEKHELEADTVELEDLSDSEDDESDVEEAHA